MSGEEEKKGKLYAAVLKKYQTLINDHEKKTVGEVKALVDVQELSLQSLVNQFKPEGYAFETHYLQVIKKVYNYLITNVTFEKIDFELNFSFTATDILKYKVADDWDSAVLLCSAMRFLGDEKAFVLVWELENFTTHATAVTETNDGFLLLDPMQGKQFLTYSGDKEHVIAGYDINQQHIQKPLYKFNDKEYEQFT